MAEFDGAIVDPASPATVTIPRADLDAAIEALTNCTGLWVSSLSKLNALRVADNLKGHRDAS